MVWVGLILLLCTTGEAGQRKKVVKYEFKTNRVDFRREKLRSGVTLLRAKAVYNFSVPFSRFSLFGWFR